MYRTLLACITLVTIVMYANASTFDDDMIENSLSYESKDLHCLAMNVYHESRSENLAGKYAVADVVMNRVRDDRYPSDVCSVVYQAETKPSWKDPTILVPKRNRCQFSWYCDGEKDTIWVQYMNGSSIESNANAWRDSVHIALDTMSDRLYDNTAGATYYYNHNLVYPHWAKVFEITEIIGNHTFMKGDH